MNQKSTLIVPILMITVGVGWLLTAMDVAPGIDWLWTLGLAIVGLLTFAVAGWNKFSVILGSFFVISSCLSLLRQTGRMAQNVEVPILVILLGVLLLVARNPAIPSPDWIDQEPPPGKPPAPGA